MNDNLQLISCSFTNEELLYCAYMPFIKGGGLFIHTLDAYPLGYQVRLSVQLMDEPTYYLIEGIVCWVTPLGAVGNKPAGIGVQFSGEKGPSFRHQIETHLGRWLKCNQITDTM